MKNDEPNIPFEGEYIIPGYNQRPRPVHVFLDEENKKAVECKPSERPFHTATQHEIKLNHLLMRGTFQESDRVLSLPIVVDRNRIEVDLKDLSIEDLRLISKYKNTIVVFKTPFYLIPKSIGIGLSPEEGYTREKNQDY